ncbi:MAG: sigma-70 family RNA polymerase sigma factor [Bacteroidota bacterium]
MSQLKKYSEEQLVSALQSKDRTALEYLYDNYSAALYGRVINIVKTKEFADEVLQDGFLQVWNKIDIYDNERSRLFTWMFNIFRNLAIDKVRSKEFRNEKKTDDIESIVYDVENNDEQDTDGIGVKELLYTLNEEQQFIVKQVYFKGYSHSEVSKEYDIPLGTVKTRLRQSLILLRKILKVE